MNTGQEQAVVSMYRALKLAQEDLAVLIQSPATKEMGKLASEHSMLVTSALREADRAFAPELLEQKQ